MYAKYIKRGLDFVLSLLALIGLSPIMLIVYILVRIKLGKPAIFKQKRPGKNEKLFTLYKFRTMTDEKDENGKLLPDEIRLTKFGKFLRSTSLDEFPQFVNVLKGDMSLVGPRPYLPREEKDMGYYYYYITQCKPGITGLWQVSGRSELCFDERLDLDLQYYKEDVGVLNNLGLAAKTVIKTLKKEGAA